MNRTYSELLGAVPAFVTSRVRPKSSQIDLSGEKLFSTLEQTGTIIWPPSPRCLTGEWAGRG